MNLKKIPQEIIREHIIPYTLQTQDLNLLLEISLKTILINNSELIFNINRSHRLIWRMLFSSNSGFMYMNNLWKFFKKHLTIREYLDFRYTIVNEFCKEYIKITNHIPDFNTYTTLDLALLIIITTFKLGKKYLSDNLHNFLLLS